VIGIHHQCVYLTHKFLDTLCLIFKIEKLVISDGLSIQGILLYLCMFVFAQACVRMHAYHFCYIGEML
jgi:hypothetical protein